MGKTVLITGTSPGIGRATAKLFAARGWSVAATARNSPSLVSSEQTNNTMTLKLDVTDEATIAAAVAATIHRFGTIDVVVNNAGYGVFGPLEGISAEQLERQFQTNVLGAAAVIRHVLPIMRQRRSGTIINLSSIAGRIAGPFQSAYHATKYALEGLSESLRFELKPHGIRVKLVEPAHFKTDFIARSLQWAKHSAYEPQLGNLMAWVSHSDENAPSPEPVAETIFKAATDPSERLRYPVNGRLFLVLRAILPDAVWRSMLGAGMNRRPKGRRAGTPQPPN